MKKENKDKIVIYEGKDGRVEFRADVEKDTIWASMDQIAELFDRDKSVISRHLTSIYKDRELDKNRTVAKNATVQNEGNHKVTRIIEYYNLDAILSVGYRVNSKQATKFRIWATGILREYLIKGFNLNQRTLTLSKEKIDNLHEAIEFIESAAGEKPIKAKLSLRLTKDIIK